MAGQRFKPWIFIALGLGATIAVGAVLASRSLSPEGGVQTETGVDAGPRPMTEEERKAYLSESVRLSDVVIGPNLKPGTDEPVPGLLEVAGQVHNQGDRAIDRLELAIYPEDASGQVIGAYLEDLAKRPLAPKESRKFRFLIPEKKEFAGKWKQELQ